MISSFRYRVTALSGFGHFAALSILLWACSSRESATEFDSVAQSLEYAPLETTPKPVGTDVELGLSGYAKVFCSAIFISRRSPEEAFVNSGSFFMPEEFQDKVTYKIDRIGQSVSLSLGDTLHRSAIYTGDQGCIIKTAEGLHFEPVKIQSSLPDANSMNWPMGDNLENSGRSSAALHPDLLSEALDEAFKPEALTAAFLVVYKGQIVAERYDLGITKDTQLESWSMGKSLTASFIGRMIQLGYIGLDDQAPVPAWQQDGDPRATITIRNLLQMSSGLYFTSHHDPEPQERYLDHFYIYTGAINAFEYSYSRPLQFPVGTEGRYRNSDPLTLGFIMRSTLESSGENYHSWGQTHLFDEIGIRKQVMETDPYGNFLLTGYDYGTARNWARLALLYLNDGVWDGERLLPEGWVDFVSSPASAWKEPVYGGLFWLNRTRTLALPVDAYYMAGGGGQRTIIVPSLDLIIVRMGHFRGAPHVAESLNKACSILVSAIKEAVHE